MSDLRDSRRECTVTLLLCATNLSTRVTRVNALNLLQKIAAIDKVMKLDRLSDDDLQVRAARSFPCAIWKISSSSSWPLSWRLLFAGTPNTRVFAKGHLSRAVRNGSQPCSTRNRPPGGRQLACKPGQAHATSSLNCEFYSRASDVRSFVGRLAVTNLRKLRSGTS